MKIFSREQFEDWLIDNESFQGARLLSVSPVPKPSSSDSPTEVTIDFAYQIEGDCKAHSTRVSRVFRIQAINIAEYRLADGIISDEHWSDGIYVLESESPIAFEIDAPAILALHCSQISVEELPKLTETVAPWLSEKEICAKVPAGLMPNPAQWQTRFHDLDQDVVWHSYCSAPVKPAKVPSSNYEGWFLQTQEDLDDSRQGIFFFYCRPDGDGFDVHIENMGASDTLWHAAITTLAAFERVRIFCGNCEFSGREFLHEWNDWKNSRDDTETSCAARPYHPEHSSGRLPTGDWEGYLLP